MRLSRPALVSAWDSQAQPPPLCAAQSSPAPSANPAALSTQHVHPTLPALRPPQTEALATAAVRAASKLRAALIVVFTVTGRTARLIAKYRPHQPILTVSPEGRVILASTIHAPR